MDSTNPLVKKLPRKVTVGVGENWDGDPIEATLERLVSKRGRPYFKLVAQGLDLPDGLDQPVSFDGVEVDMGDELESESGNLYRHGELDIEVGGVPCRLKATIVEGKKPYWVSLLVNVRKGATADVAVKPVQGGSIVGL